MFIWVAYTRHDAPWCVEEMILSCSHWISNSSVGFLKFVFGSMSVFFSGFNAETSSLKCATVWQYVANICNPPYCKLLSCVSKGSRDDFPRKMYIAIDYRAQIDNHTLCMPFVILNRRRYRIKLLHLNEAAEERSRLCNWLSWRIWTQLKQRTERHCGKWNITHHVKYTHCKWERCSWNKWDNL